MQMPFFPSYEEKFTRTPNVFFDEVLPIATANESRIVGYLIRNTIGYNKDDSAWVGKSREDLIKEAGVSNTQLTKAITSCENKGWIITYKKGINGRETRYFFLNDPLNVMIVEGLNRELFSVNDLKYLNTAGIKKMLSDNGLKETPPETGELPLPKRESYPSRNGRATPPETGEVKTSPAQAGRGITDTLNTVFKNNSFKDIVCVADAIMEKAQESLGIAPTKYGEGEIQKWLTKYTEAHIIEQIEIIKEQGSDNPLRSLREALQRPWDRKKGKVSGNRKKSNTSESVKSERVVPAAQPGKYERFYQVYGNQQQNNSR